MTSKRPGEKGDAQIIPIEALTRQATLRRFAEVARRTDAMPGELRRSLGELHGRHGSVLSEALADLVYDSDDDEELLAGVRGAGGGTRRLTFESGEVSVELEVTLTGRRSVLCQVVPAQAAELELRGVNGEGRTQSDPHGTFHLSDVASGPLSLRLELEGASRPIVTAWVRV